MKAINAMTDDERAALLERLRRAMRAAERVLGLSAFRKPSRHGRRAPVNKALFEVWAVVLDGLSDEDTELLVSRSGKLTEQFEAVFEANREFERSLSQGTGDPAKVRLRFAIVAGLVQEVLA